MKLKRTLVAPVAVVGIALVSGGWLLQRATPPGGATGADARVLDEVFRYVAERYVEPQSRDELYEKAVQGLLRELGDPHTSYLTAEDYNALRIQTTGEYGGLGIQISERDGWVTVIAPLPGTPAERAGVRAGDRIIEVEGQSTKGWSDDDAVKVLRGPRGSPVNIKVARFGVDEPIAFRIVREEIHVQSVPYAYMVEPGVGLVRLVVFSETSTDEIRTAIERLRKQGMKKLILDLRENPGGLLDQGVSVSDLFLDRGDAIVETRTRDPRQTETFRAETGQALPEFPMVVLVNAYSASAAEIVAGALQDHDRALVVGTTSFGKGSVQTLFPLSGGNFLKMTTGKWYTPSGRSIQKEMEAQEGALVADMEIAEDGTPIGGADGAPADTAGRQTYRTDGGRIVYGGGGIVPDVIVTPDTASTLEKEFWQAAFKGGNKFQDVLFRYALEVARTHPNLRPDFQVTPAMRAELFRRLQSAGIEVTQAQFVGAAKSIDQQIAFEVVQAKFGPAAAQERANASNAIVRRAVDLLRGAGTQQALFSAAQSQQRAAARE